MCEGISPWQTQHGGVQGLTSHPFQKLDLIFDLLSTAALEWILQVLRAIA